MKFDTTNEFLAAVRAGRLEFVRSGSERGYLAKKYYPNGLYCGVVRRGRRAGLHKYQKSGKGGPHSNSSNFVTNLYYWEVAK